MRLFVAGYPPAAVADHLAEFVATLAVGRLAASGINTRLAAASNWHVTLAFLGEVPERQLPGVRAAVDAAVAARGGAERPRLRVAGGGRFGKGKFTLLWAGLQGDVPALRTLASAVTRELRRRRLDHDGKPFKAHLTIARPGERLPAEEVAADVAAFAGYEGPEWTLDELVLVRSHLGPKPTYDRLNTWPL